MLLGASLRCYLEHVNPSNSWALETVLRLAATLLKSDFQKSWIHVKLGRPSMGSWMSWSSIFFLVTRGCLADILVCICRLLCSLNKLAQDAS